MEQQTSSGSLPAARTSCLLSLLVRLLDERVDLVLKELCDLHLVPEVEPPSSAMSLSTTLSKPVHGAQGDGASPSARDIASNEPGRVIKYPVDRDGFGDDAAVPAPPHGQINRVFGRTPAACASPYLKRVSIPMSPLPNTRTRKRTGSGAAGLLVAHAPALELTGNVSRTDPDERRRRKNVAGSAGSESPDGVTRTIKDLDNTNTEDAALVKIVLAQDPDPCPIPGRALRNYVDADVVRNTAGIHWAFIKVIIDFKTPDRASPAREAAVARASPRTIQRSCFAGTGVSVFASPLRLHFHRGEGPRVQRWRDETAKLEFQGVGCRFSARPTAHPTVTSSPHDEAASTHGVTFTPRVWAELLPCATVLAGAVRQRSGCNQEPHERLLLHAPHAAVAIHALIEQARAAASVPCRRPLLAPSTAGPRWAAQQLYVATAAARSVSQQRGGGLRALSVAMPLGWGASCSTSCHVTQMSGGPCFSMRRSPFSLVRAQVLRTAGGRVELLVGAVLSPRWRSASRHPPTSLALARDASLTRTLHASVCTYNDSMSSCIHRARCRGGRRFKRTLVGRLCAYTVCSHRGAAAKEGGKRCFPVRYPCLAPGVFRVDAGASVLGTLECLHSLVHLGLFIPHDADVFVPHGELSGFAARACFLLASRSRGAAS
ncbi:hypothetical protein K438DRAFT_1983017 [Mycena galopus ATCC 62051]|nr:hypothetical protein K438DRAFT_1983017 [Mycena galopus ATCC 62051]